MADGEGGGDAVAQSAIEQIREKGYAEKYRDRGEPVHLVGVAFDQSLRNLAAVKVAQA